MTQERTVIAHFPVDVEADAVAGDLNRIGIRDVHIKRNYKYGLMLGESSHTILQADSLIDLAYSSAPSFAEAVSSRILTGSDPVLSQTDGQGLACGHAFTVVAFVPESRLDEAINIIKRHRGIV